VSSRPKTYGFTDKDEGGGGGRSREGLRDFLEGNWKKKGLAFHEKNGSNEVRGKRKKRGKGDRNATGGWRNNLAAKETAKKI